MFRFDTSLFLNTNANSNRLIYIITTNVANFTKHPATSTKLDCKLKTERTTEKKCYVKDPCCVIHRFFSPFIKPNLRSPEGRSSVSFPPFNHTAQGTRFRQFNTTPWWRCDFVRWTTCEGSLLFKFLQDFKRGSVGRKLFFYLGWYICNKVGDDPAVEWSDALTHKSLERIG